MRLHRKRERGENRRRNPAISLHERADKTPVESDAPHIYFSYKISLDNEYGVPLIFFVIDNSMIPVR
jgi:hypothetical protein